MIEENKQHKILPAPIISNGITEIDVPPISEKNLTETITNITTTIAAPIIRERIPEFTSQHATALPGTESFLVVTDSFASNVKKPAEWKAGEGFDLITPSGQLRIQGNSEGENTTLQHYVQKLGPEGLKELAVIFDVYHLFTQGQGQSLNVEVTAKQILQRMGKGEHANNQELQRHLVNTVLYLASSMVVRINKDSQGAHGRMSPLLVLESISDGPGGIRVKYHLGEDTYEALYGSEPKVYPLPTPLVMGYHGIRSQYVLNLTFHLGNLLAEGSCSLYFPTICVHGGLALERLFPKEKNRIRDAQYIISALLQLEKEEYLECRAHPDLDMAVAVDLYQGKIQEDEISPMHLERILALCESLNGMQKNALNAKRRQVMQRLLNLNASRENIAKENPEFCTRITVLAGARFLEKKKQLIEKIEH